MALHRPIGAADDHLPPAAYAWRRRGELRVAELRGALMEEEPVHYERPCPRCGMAVTFGATGRVVVPGVTSCGNCGAEVSFSGGLHGSMGGRVVHADRGHPREAGAGEAAGWKSTT